MQSQCGVRKCPLGGWVIQSFSTFHTKIYFVLKHIVGVYNHVEGIRSPSVSGYTGYAAHFIIQIIWKNVLEYD